jgi:hypothetical protein
VHTINCTTKHLLPWVTQYEDGLGGYIEPPVPHTHVVQVGAAQLHCVLACC